MMQIQRGIQGYVYTWQATQRYVVQRTYKSVLKLVKILYQYLLQKVGIRDNEKGPLAKIQSTVEDSKGEKQVCTVHKLHNTSYIQTYILCLCVYTLNVGTSSKDGSICTQ